jgi:signal transduction histidine kinase/DNA-binding response OmpR family regulator
MRVLIVEDHKDLALAIATGLRREGMAVDVAFDGQEGLRHGVQDAYDVVVLDRDLPGLHGDDVCRELVAARSRARVLMLTAADTIESRVDGLGLGADDYLPKPFAFAELVARIRALARRSQPASPPVLASGDIQLDTIQRVARRGGRRLELSPKELAVLELLLAAEGAPLSTEELLERDLGRVCRLVQRRRQGDDQPPATQARRARRDRDSAPRGLPDPHMKVSALAAALTRRWRSLPPRTIRLRLTVIYGSLFILSGAALDAITYGLVSSQYTTGFFITSGKHASSAAVVVRRHASQPVSVSISGTINAGGTTGLPGTLPGGAKLPSPQVLATIAQGQSTAARGTLLLYSGIALAIMALIAIWLGWIVAGRALRPLRAITATAQDISATNLHRRLALDGPDDELKQLGSTFDALLERLETAFAAQRQFAANVSHELRTPLTFERTLLEVALADPAVDAGTLRTVCEQVLAAGQQQERLIDALLTLSRSQRGLDHREPIDLAAIAGRALASIDSAGLTVEGTLRPARIDGDPSLIERLANNLITNAVQHNRPGGELSLTTYADHERAVLAVANSGAAIPPGDLDRLFEPFQRLDGSRTTTTNGTGLGLSIVKAIAEAHGATIATSLPAEGGLSIEVSFPTTEPARAPQANANRPDPRASTNTTDEVPVTGPGS